MHGTKVNNKKKRKRNYLAFAMFVSLSFVQYLHTYAVQHRPNVLLIFFCKKKKLVIIGIWKYSMVYSLRPALLVA